MLEAEHFLIQTFSNFKYFLVLNKKQRERERERQKKKSEKEFLLEIHNKQAANVFLSLPLTLRPYFPYPFLLFFFNNVFLFLS